MKAALAGVLAIAALLGTLIVFLAAASPFPDAPFRVHVWSPVPVACAGLRCVTYRGWAGAARKAGNTHDRLPLLAEMLASRAAPVVARRSGLRVPPSEVDAALRAVEELAADDPSLKALLSATYGDLRGSRFRQGLTDLLLREKLRAAGFSTAWESPAAPPVMVLSARYRWDAATHRVVAR